MDTSRLPVVDLSSSDAVENLRLAANEFGFCYVVGHGVDDSILRRMFDISHELFSMGEKQLSRECGIEKSETNGIRGFFRLGSENLAEEERALSTPSGDYKEGFDVGRDFSEEEHELHPSIVGRNVWPSEDCHWHKLHAAEFRETVEEYYRQMLRLSEKLLSLFERIIGVPEGWLQARCKRAAATLRLLHYPAPTPDVPEPQLLGCGAHTDYGLFTLLAVDSKPGLQIQRQHGLSTASWEDVTALTGSFIVNIGDMFQQWTRLCPSGSRLQSTVHRVIRPNSERYSIPFFFNPDLETKISPSEIRGVIERCSGVVTESKTNQDDQLDIETCEEILLRRYVSTFNHKSSSLCE